MMQKDLLLSTVTTFRIGGPAKFFFNINSLSELKAGIEFSFKEEIPYFILGGGSNVLFQDSGYKGLVLRFANKNVSIQNEINGYRVEIDAGKNFDSLIEMLVTQNISGIENLSYIPGYAGASAVQNIGAYGVDISQFVDGVLVLDTKKMTTMNLSNAECGFKYRDSIFKKDEGKDLVILKIILKFKKNSELNLSYEEIKELIKNEKNITPRILREIVIKIRKNKLPEISEYGSAGSFFKNPIIDKEEFELLQRKYPQIKGWNEGNKKTKISAAYLIDKVGGMKGKEVNDAFVWDKQALVIANKGNAKAVDVLELAKRIENKIFELTKIKLEKEVQII